MGWLSIAGIPIILFSLYLQFIELKQTCFLCLSASLIVIIQAGTFALIGDLEYSKASVIQFIFLSSAISAGLIFGRNLFLQVNKLKTENRTLKRIKRDFRTFSTLRTPIKSPESLKEMEPIVIGYPEAPLRLSLFISPHCSHCNTAYKETVSLTECFPNDIKLEVYYNLSLEYENPALDIARHVLQINKRIPALTRQALEDWHLKGVDMEKWLEKWQQDEIEISIDQEILKQYNWCRLNYFRFTPVKILNNHKIPEAYNISEVSFFFGELINEESSTLEFEVSALANSID